MGEGSYRSLSAMTPGDFFGEMTLLDGMPRSADAIALEPAEVLVLDQVAFILECEVRLLICSGGESRETVEKEDEQGRSRNGHASIVRPARRGGNGIGKLSP